MTVDEFFHQSLSALKHCTCAQNQRSWAKLRESQGSQTLRLRKESTILGQVWVKNSNENGPKCVKVVKKQASRNSLPDQADLPDQAEMGGRTAGPNLPSTRAGGQDDGSYTNSLITDSPASE